MKLERIFRREPPDELVLRYLAVLGIKGYDDAHWWPRSLVQSKADELDELLLELEPYYMKHKRFHVTRRMTISSYLTVLRHLVHSKHLELEIKYTSSVKFQSDTFHRLVNPNPRFLTEEDFTVSFS